jgi:hypothetical protein
MTREVSDQDAVEIGNLYVKARDASVEAANSYLKAGHKLKEKKASLPRGKWGDWLTANERVLGFNGWTAQRLMKQCNKYVASHVFEDEQEAIQYSRDLWGHKAPAKPRCIATQSAAADLNSPKPTSVLDLVRSITL